MTVAPPPVGPPPGSPAWPYTSSYPPPPPPLPPPPAGDGLPTKPARRRRWVWVAVAAVVAVLGTVLLAAVVADRALRRLDTYRADLTHGSGDFEATENGDIALSYEHDGYHATLRTPGWLVSGVEAPSSHTTLSAEVTVGAVTVPRGAQFGVFVLANRGGAGYAVTLAESGTVSLYSISADGTVTTLLAADGPALGAGATHAVMITCVIDGSTTRLSGYVDGVRELGTSTASVISSSSATGMIGYSPTAPAEWVATKFARLGPDDLPADAARTAVHGFVG